MDNFINKRIAELRNLKGLTQADFANCLGIKPSTYSRKESKGTFKPNELAKISQLLGITIAELFSTSAKDAEGATKNDTATDAQPERLRQPSSFENEKSEKDEIYPLQPSERNILQIIRHAPKNDKNFILEVVEYCYKNPNLTTKKRESVINELKK